MALVIASRRTVDHLVYPAGFVGNVAHAAAGCRGCAGEEGDCTLATRVRGDLVELADGRVVLTSEGATQLQVEAAVLAKYGVL